MRKEKISMAVIKRLPRYYRYLDEMLKNGITKTSSKELSQRMRLTASQIRQDLNCFGGFGQQGYGYNVESLHKEMGSILGIYKGYTAVLIGVGNLGRAVANYFGANSSGVKIVGMFDINESMIGAKINDIEVMHIDLIDNFMPEHKPDIAILTLPKTDLSYITKKLKALGVKGFWNFSNVDIRVEGVHIENVHLSDSLMILCYKIGQ